MLACSRRLLKNRGKNERLELPIGNIPGRVRKNTPQLLDGLGWMEYTVIMNFIAVDI